MTHDLTTGDVALVNLVSSQSLMIDFCTWLLGLGCFVSALLVSGATTNSHDCAAHLLSNLRLTANLWTAYGPPK